MFSCSLIFFFLTWRKFLVVGVKIFLAETKSELTFRSFNPELIHSCPLRKNALTHKLGRSTWCQFLMSLVSLFIKNAAKKRSLVVLISKDAIDATSLLLGSFLPPSIVEHTENYGPCCYK